MQNQTTVTKSLFIEGMLRISRDGYGKTARRSVLVLLGLWVALLIFTIVIQGDLLQTFGILALLGFICFWILVIMPRSNAKRFWKSQEARYGSAMERTTYFFDDHLEILGDGVEKTLSYADITQIQYSRRLMLLITADKVGVLLALDGFTDCTPRQIEELIHKEDIEHD